MHRASRSFLCGCKSRCQLFIGTGRSDDGIDQAGSGVADECTCSSGAKSASICRSSVIDKTDGLSLVSVVIQAVYSAKVAVFEELGAAPNQLGASQSDHNPLTFPEIRTASCDLHELHRIWFPTCGVKIYFMSASSKSWSDPGVELE
ncbi:hypothetical protein Tco_1006926 [Tanacetum coccineum]|uniref:Uncharacterized protein n=1 Tax=Tanacetum coccineum TaxID=301880 RepID=A0ABQ5FKH0_9ASTR